jgi:hypothetical protein
MVMMVTMIISMCSGINFSPSDDEACWSCSEAMIRKLVSDTGGELKVVRNERECMSEAVKSVNPVTNFRGDFEFTPHLKIKVTFVSPRKCRHLALLQRLVYTLSHTLLHCAVPRLLILLFPCSVAAAAAACGPCQLLVCCLTKMSCTGIGVGCGGRCGHILLSKCRACLLSKSVQKVLLARTCIRLSAVLHACLPSCSARYSSLICVYLTIQVVYCFSLSMRLGRGRRPRRWWTQDDN